MSTSLRSDSAKMPDPLEEHESQKGWGWLSSWRFRYFIFVFLIYLLAAPLDITTTNPGSRFMLTKSFAKYWRFWILPEDQERYSHLDYSLYKDKIYSDKAPGPSILMVPFYWIAQVAYLAQAQLHQGTATDQEVDDLAKMLIVIFLLIFHSITVIRTYDLCRLLGFDHIPSFICSFALAFASIWYPYTPTFFSHAIIGSLLIHSIYHLFRSKASSWILKDLLIGGIFASLALSAEYTIMFLIPCLLCYILLPLKASRSWIEEKLKHVGVFGIPVLITAILLAIYHIICFENPFSTPYTYSYYFANDQHFLAPIENGLYVLLFSSNHGLFYFMPLAFLSLICVPSLYRRYPAETSLLVSMFLIVLIWISKFFKPDGGLAWSTRHLVSVTPLLVIPLVAGLQSRKKSFFFLFSVFGILSFIFNASAAWIRLWPTGGEGMTNPLFGSEGDIGHLERLFTWISIEVTSLNPIDWLILTPSGPQSTLYRDYPLVFWLIAYLAVLINPFFSVFPGNKLNSSNPRFQLISSPEEGLFASLGFGMIVTAFLLAHITFLGANLSTKPGASELYKLHESDLAILLLTIILWGIILLAEIRRTESNPPIINLRQGVSQGFFEPVFNYGLFFLVVLVDPIIQDPWLSAFLSLSFVIPLAYISVSPKGKSSLLIYSTLLIIPLLLIWEQIFGTIVVWISFYILTRPLPNPSQDIRDSTLRFWIEAGREISHSQLIVGVVTFFALTNEYFGLRSIQSFFLISTLALCLVEVTVRSAFSIYAYYDYSKENEPPQFLETMLPILDTILLWNILVILSGFLDVAMISPLDLGMTANFPQVLTFAFWLSTIVIFISIYVNLSQKKSTDVHPLGMGC
ncbi:MAG: hypothetical protein ACE5OZ_15340 [Candidatus Heimdallarchaeota archaeon]